MSTRMLLRCCVVLSLAIGCTKRASSPAPNTAEFDFPNRQTAESTPTTASDGTTTRDLKEFDFSPQREQELLKQLERSPNDAAVLLQLAKLTQVTAKRSNDAHAGYKKSAAYLHQALAADPTIGASESFREIAGIAFLNEARALSRDEHVEASLESLKLVLEYIPAMPERMIANPDLANVRQSNGYAAFEKLMREKRRTHAAVAVDALFVEKPDFRFDFELIDTDGKTLSKKEFAGKLLMVNVWGTWCSPCRAELPDLVAAHDKFKSQGFEIVGINSETESEDVANLLIRKAQQQFGITYRCALGGEETFKQIPNLSGIPTSIFMDRKGNVRARIVGMVDATTLELIIERLLKDSPNEPTAADATN